MLLITLYTLIAVMGKGNYSFTRHTDSGVDCVRLRRVAIAEHWPKSVRLDYPTVAADASA